MHYEFLETKQSGTHLWVTLNRPKANAISLEVVQELRAVLDDALGDAAVGCILITGGDNKFFSAGADVPSIQAQLDNTMAPGMLLSEGAKLMEYIESYPKPVVAVVNGLCLGGGCELALACHLRIAADTASFGQPEINLGILPGWGGTYRLPRLIGASRALDWLLTGRMVSADEALHAGLVCQVVQVSELVAVAEGLAASLARKSRSAVAAILDTVYRGGRVPADGPVLEREAFARVAATKDAAEGIAAFLEKRAPNFTGE